MFGLSNFIITEFLLIFYLLVTNVLYSYNIVFAPKYRRQIIYGRIKADVGKILRDLCNRKNVEIIEAECCPDHIHMLVTIPPHLSVSSFMG